METWIKVNDYEYEVSSEGRMRSLPRTVTQKCSKGGHTATHNYEGKILKPGKEPRSNGFYHSYRLSKPGETKKVLAHQQVVKYFLPNPNNKPHINHIDNNPENNALSNLEWCTRSENELHKYKMGYRQVQSKFSPEEVRVLRQSNRSYSDISREYKVSISTVSKMMKKESYKNV